MIYLVTIKEYPKDNSYPKQVQVAFSSNVLQSSEYHATKELLYTLGWKAVNGCNHTFEKEGIILECRVNMLDMLCITDFKKNTEYSQLAYDVLFNQVKSH